MQHVLRDATRRSIYPASDGSGRDTYISFGNGGNTLMYQPSAKGITNGELRRSPSSGYLPPSGGPISPKTVFYDTDGTGRDTYIA